MPIGGFFASTLPDPRAMRRRARCASGWRRRRGCSAASRPASPPADARPARCAARRNSAPRIEIASSIPVPVSPSVGPGLSGGPSASPVMLMVPPQACAIMSKARLFSNGQPSPKPFTWAVDDRRVERADHVGAEAEPLDRAGGEILDEHVGLGGEVLDQIEAARVLQVDGEGFLVGVELQEVMRVLARRRVELAAGIAGFRVLDLHHFGAQPGQGLGAGRPRLELREVQDFHARQTGFRAVCRHHRFLLRFGQSPLAQNPTTGGRARRGPARLPAPRRRRRIA